MTSPSPEDGLNVWYHSGDAYLTRQNVRPGLHVGTLAQATMRTGRALTRITLDRDVFSRVSDDVTSPRVKRIIMEAHRNGIPGLRYLNRVEGIPLEEFKAALVKLGKRADGRNRLDTISDARFRRLLPSAHDSLVILDPSIIVSLEPVNEERKAA